MHGMRAAATSAVAASTSTDNVRVAGARAITLSFWDVDMASSPIGLPDPLPVMAGELARIVICRCVERHIIGDSNRGPDARRKSAYGGQADYICSLRVVLFVTHSGLQDRIRSRLDCTL